MAKTKITSSVSEWKLIHEAICRRIASEERAALIIKIHNAALSPQYFDETIVDIRLGKRLLNSMISTIDNSGIISRDAHRELLSKIAPQIKTALNAKAAKKNIQLIVNSEVITLLYSTLEHLRSAAFGHYIGGEDPVIIDKAVSKATMALAIARGDAHAS